MIERVARRLHQRNAYVVNKIGKKELEHLLSVANVLHCKNPLDVEDEWIEEWIRRGKQGCDSSRSGTCDNDSDSASNGKSLSEINL